MHISIVIPLAGKDAAFAYSSGVADGKKMDADLADLFTFKFVDFSLKGYEADSSIAALIMV